MVDWCTNCDIRGAEKRVPGTFTLESCKQACRNDASCYAIDFGHSGRSKGKCFVTTVPVYYNVWDQNGEYSGYKKVDCSTMPSYGPGAGIN